MATNAYDDTRTTDPERIDGVDWLRSLEVEEATGAEYVGMKDGSMIGYDKGGGVEFHSINIEEYDEMEYFFLSFSVANNDRPITRYTKSVQRLYVSIFVSARWW